MNIYKFYRIQISKWKKPKRLNGICKSKSLKISQNYRFCRPKFNEKFRLTVKKSNTQSQKFLKKKGVQLKKKNMTKLKNKK